MSQELHCHEEPAIAWKHIPKVLKPRVQVDEAQARFRTASMLVTCLPLDASPEENHRSEHDSIIHTQVIPTLPTTTQKIFEHL